MLLKSQMYLEVGGRAQNVCRLNSILVSTANTQIESSWTTQRRAVRTYDQGAPELYGAAQGNL